MSSYVLGIQILMIGNFVGSIWHLVEAISVTLISTVFKSYFLNEGLELCLTSNPDLVLNVSATDRGVFTGTNEFNPVGTEPHNILILVLY